MMPTPPTDRTDPATLAAAEGLAALGRGDTALARAKFVEAGDILLRDIAGAYKHSDKTLLRFLAATQYYKGGEYRRALELAKKIEARVLPQKTRGLLPQFLRDVEFRAAVDYQTRMKQTFAHLWLSNQHRQVLDLLKDHPYVYEPGPLAFLRKGLCEELGHWRAAAIFYAMILSTVPEDNDLMVFAASCPLRLPSEGKLPEAWDYARHLLELAPNGVTYMVASIVTFFRASRLQGVERLQRHREQIGYFDEAWRAYRALPDSRQRNEEMRLVMSACFDAASLGLMRLGDDRKALTLAEEAIKFDPSAPGPLSTRGMLTYPAEQAVRDFRQASKSPTEGYIPFYYLAHHAFMHGQFREAIALCEQALERRPGRPITAQLHGWIAVCRDSLGADRGEVDRLFQRALEIDANNEQVGENYRIFKETTSTAPTTRASQWNTKIVKDDVEPDLVSWLAEHLVGTNRAKSHAETLLAS